MKIVMIAAASVVAFIAAMVFFENVYAPRLNVSGRLDEVEEIGVSERNRKKKDTKETMLQRLSIFRISGDMRQTIILSGISLKPEEFVLVWIMGAMFLTVVFFTLTLDFIRTGIILIFVIAAPPMYIKFLYDRRCQLFQQQLGDALMIIANGLRAGFSFQQALENVANSMKDPINIELLTAVREMKLGADMEEALTGVANRMKSDDFRMLTTAAVVQQQVGGNLSEIMDTISQTIRDRMSVARSVRTLSAQGRMSGLIVGCLPLVILAFVAFSNPTYIVPLYTTIYGQVMIAIGIVMESIGFLIIRKIVDIKL